ncbi:histone-lysine N-methyltransferase EHMT1 isoform X2 [Cylas formicarius]|uniref:histone-lysine N-methyltransferase EHMT1 isoform X2 n=1 Tax=Cylas formicarius TaxID=197179 RepID=UPI002958CDC8|nr:histone-lysine N-methyltransferase EHMT1 isoform X2 [Cylas formicarius]
MEMNRTEEEIHERNNDQLSVNDLLGQMKTQFNKSETIDQSDEQASNTENNSQVNADLKEFENFEKFILESTNGNAPENIEPRTAEIQVSNHYKEDALIKKELRSPDPVLIYKKKEMKDSNKSTLKRSSRRRSTKGSGSILQSAIARKEKSYIDCSKPQRLTKRIRSKIKVVEERSRRNLVTKRLKSGKTVKNFKSFSDNETETDYNESHSQQLEPNLRRSERISSSDSKDEKTKSIKELSLTKDPDLEKKISISEEFLKSRLCRCTENNNLFMNTAENESAYCTAIDSIDDKLIGCSKLVDCLSTPILRPSQRVPYGLLCDLHKNRLIRHNCCPTCGIFCTQGQFMECELKHQYHKDCRLSVGQSERCPHCGSFAPCTEIFITMHTTKKPIFLPTQRSHDSSSKMSFEPSRASPPKTDDVPDTLQLSLMDCSQNDCNEQDLLEAIADGDEGKVIATIEKGSIDVNSKFPELNDGTLLHFASRRGNKAIVDLLISARIEIDVFDQEQNTALMLAIVERNNDIAQYLIQAGADITLKGTDGMTALHVAAKCGNTEACELLLRAGFGIRNFVNFQDDGGWTPLVWACENGHADAVKYLMLNGADVLLRDVEQNSAIHWAAFGGSTEIVELLLNWGCDVDAMNVHGDTPLHLSAREDKSECVTLLLSRRANVILTNKNNETPLECVPRDGSSYNAIALNVRLQPSFPKKSPLLTNDISRGREQNPIQCVNEVDDECEPRDYFYVRKICSSSPNVTVDTNMAKVQLCSCEDRCMSTECNCSRLSTHRWYEADGKLIPEFNFVDAPLIFECNELCSCNAITCVNRVLQKGSTHRFQLFKTAAKGWGVKTLNAISKGSYVCEYVGEILTDKEADRREDDTYLFDLDNRENDSFCVDAKFYGNVARFVNHSCNPNLHSIKVFVDHQDNRFPRIGLFAKCDIMAGEELSFDYGDKFWLVKYKLFTCECGASNCKYSSEAIQATLEKYLESS